MPRMLVCSACSTEIPRDASQCPRCGGRSFTALEDVATRVRAGAVATRVADPAPVPIVKDVFTAGDLLADRYRIVGLLGRGGMGEVYRADDLSLGQAVALKFLPRDVDRHPEHLERMRAEVRITRQVSHPNVCRVYDLGSIAGRHFLTMEYIDGEDLASLLRRIGRLPPDKALDIARQLCAALAAAHDRGVIHRDLKPANIMLDGRGRVRVTDFGLAVAADGSDGTGDRSGTPAYMAPEQLGGAPLSIQTDIYALGLVLFELFTGRRFFAAKNLEQLRTLQSDTQRMQQSASDINLDPAVERVIKRCVEFVPSGRPNSALAVAAALPGGDPLAAALAAGETPSPALVAAAADEALFSTRITAALLTVTIVGALIASIGSARRSPFSVLDPPYSADVLAVKAGELLQRLRPGDAATYVASSFDADAAFTSYTVQRRDTSWIRDLPGITPSPVQFWYRTSPAALMPVEFPGIGRVTPTDPPRTTAGMTFLITDVRGRLMYLDAKPSLEDEKRPPTAELPWTPLFREAGLDLAAFTPAQPERLPMSWGDARAAWTGKAPQYGVPVQVEAAAYRGRPTYFVIAAPWTAKPGTPRARPAAWQIALVLVVLALAAVPFAAALLMARSSIKSGRADRTGAVRLATTVGAAQLAATWFGMAHVGSPIEVLLLLEGLVMPMIVAAVVWTLYIGLEPYVRRTWPTALVSWTRLLEGRARDARVARDLLVGVAAAGFLRAFVPLLDRVAPSPRISAASWIAAMGLRHAMSGLFSGVTSTIVASLAVVILMCVVRMILRREAFVTAAFGVVVAFVISVSFLIGFSPTPLGIAVILAYGAITGTVWATLVMRFGLVAFFAYQLSDTMLGNVDTINPSVWYAGPSLLNVAAFAAITAYAAWVCLSSPAPRVSPVLPVGR